MKSGGFLGPPPISARFGHEFQRTLFRGNVTRILALLVPRVHFIDGVPNPTVAFLRLTSAVFGCVNRPEIHTRRKATVIGIFRVLPPSDSGPTDTKHLANFAHRVVALHEPALERGE